MEFRLIKEIANYRDYNKKTGVCYMFKEMRERELAVSNLLKNGWLMYCKEFQNIIILMFIGLLPTATFQYIVSLNPTKLTLTTGILGIVAMIVIGIMSMAVILIVENKINDDKIEMDWTIATYKAYARLGSCIGTSLLSALILMGLIVLLIIPAFIWSIYYIFLLQVVVLRGIDGKVALDYSKSLVKGRWWKIFRLLVILGFINAALHFLIALGCGIFLPQVFVTTISMGLNVFLLGFQTVLLTILFLNLDYLNHGNDGE